MPPLSNEKKQLRSDRVELKEAVGDFKRAETATQTTAATKRILNVVQKGTGYRLFDDGDGVPQQLASVIVNLNPGQVLNMGIAEAVKSNLQQCGESLEVPEPVLKRLDKLV